MSFRELCTMPKVPLNFTAFFFNICVWARTHMCVHLLHLCNSLCDFIAHKIWGGETAVHNAGSFSPPGLLARLVLLMFRWAVILIQRNYSKGSSSKGTDGELRKERKLWKAAKTFVWFPLLQQIIVWLWFCLHPHHSSLSPAKVCEHYLAPLRSSMVIIKIPHIWPTPLEFFEISQQIWFIVINFRPLGISVYILTHPSHRSNFGTLGDKIPRHMSSKVLEGAELCWKCLMIKILIKVFYCFMQMAG